MTKYFKNTQARYNFLNNMNTVFSLGCPASDSIKHIMQEFMDEDIDPTKGRMYEGMYAALLYYVGQYSKVLKQYVEEHDTVSFRKAYIEINKLYGNKYKLL